MKLIVELETDFESDRYQKHACMANALGEIQTAVTGGSRSGAIDLVDGYRADWRIEGDEDED